MYSQGSSGLHDPWADVERLSVVFFSVSAAVSTHPCLLILVYSSLSTHPCLLIPVYSSPSTHPCLPTPVYSSLFTTHCLLIPVYSSLSTHPCLLIPAYSPPLSTHPCPLIPVYSSLSACLPNRALSTSPLSCQADCGKHFRQAGRHISGAQKRAQPKLVGMQTSRSTCRLH